MKGTRVQIAPQEFAGRVAAFPLERARPSRAPGQRPMVLGPAEVDALKADIAQLAGMTERLSDIEAIAAVIMGRTGSTERIARAAAEQIAQFVAAGHARRK
jgi:hypothetical protein